MAKKKTKRETMKVTYQSTAEARATAGNIPVFCAFDKLIDPKDLVGNPRNPNQHPADQIHLLAHIIQSQGWRAPITVSNQSGYVVRGHGRLAAALEFGAECVPVDYQNYSTGDFHPRPQMASGGRRQDFYYAMTAAGLLERQTIIWAKNGIALGHADYQWAHEPCFYCSKGENAPRFFGDRAQHTVWRITRRESGTMETTISGGITITDGAGSKMHITEKPPKDKKSRYLRVEKGKGVYLYNEGKENTLWEVSREAGAEHPTQKPVELAQRAIENSTQEGEIVLDLFGGSGTTLIAAELTRRTAFLTEIDPKYVDVIVSRYARITGNVAGICVRDGKEIPYAVLKQEWEAANGLESELR